MPYVKEALKRKEKELVNLQKRAASELSACEAKLPLQDKTRLRISGRGEAAEYYLTSHENGQTTETYLKKDQAAIAGLLANRDYNRKLLKEIDSQLDQIRKLLKNYDERAIIEPYERLSKQRKQLFKPLVPDDKTYCELWQNVSYEPYQYKENGADTAVFTTERGERVRSKSEKIIADYYDRRGIPYRYEYPLALKDGRRLITRHPDFTVLNPRTRQVFYHEHFGRMDDPGYVMKMLERLDLYQSNGLYPGEKLLMTFESSSRPLAMPQLERIIKKYLI